MRFEVVRIFGFTVFTTLVFGFASYRAAANAASGQIFPLLELLLLPDRREQK